MAQGDLRRIAFVTRRFEALQGLRWAGCGAAILIIVGVMQAVPGWTRDPRLQLFLLANTVLILTPRALDDYYGASFGTVYTGTYPGGPGVGPRAQGPALAVMLGLAIDAMDFGIARWVPSAAAFACMGVSAWLLVRDWPHRPHYVLGLAGGIVAWSFAAQAPPSPDAFTLHPAAAAYYLTSSNLVGFVLLACGLLDHRLLATALSARNRVRREAERPGPYQGKLRAMLAAIALGCCGFMFLQPVTAAATVGLTFLLIPLAMTPFLFWGLWRDMAWKQAYSDLTSAREARLLARLTGDPVASEVREEPEPPRVAPPDLFGHLVLPLLMAVGLIVDVAWRGHAFPSLAALALTASHMWIAIRDWPFRKHYLLGAVAGLAIAIQHMAIGSMRPMDWALRSVALLSVVMLAEGLLDYRLESRHARSSSDTEHAHSV